VDDTSASIVGVYDVIEVVKSAESLIKFTALLAAHCR